MTKFYFFCSCPIGLENSLIEELKEISCKKGSSIQIESGLPLSAKGGIYCHGDLSDMMSINLYSRIAGRVLIQVEQGSYRDENDVYNMAKAYPWESWFDSKKTIRIDCHAKQTQLKSINFITLRIKDAICDRLREKFGERPFVDTFNPDVRVFAFLTAEKIIFYLDTSGSSLFKRGWRLEKGAAPMKENLAAGVLRLINWQPGTPLLDPMCGSGTILVEAAQTILKIPPGYKRVFGFENFLSFSKEKWQNIKKEAENDMQAVMSSRSTTDALALLKGSDISEKMIKIAERNLLRAGIPSISLKQLNACSISKHFDRFPPGIIFMNPPYGERIVTQGDITKDLSYEKHSSQENYRILDDGNTLNDPSFFKQFGDILKQNFVEWRAFVLTTNRHFPKILQLKESRKIPLFNGKLECRLFRFDLVEGSMRKTKSNLPKKNV